MRDGGDRVERVVRLVVAERLDDRAAEEVLAAADVANERLPHASDRRRCGGERARRATGRDEFGLLLVERGKQLRHQRRIGIVLEEAVGDGPQPIVRARSATRAWRLSSVDR